METSDEKVILVTDQPPLSGIGVYVTQLSDLLRSSFPRIEIRNLHYFRHDSHPFHLPVPGLAHAKSRPEALFALRHNERMFARLVRGSKALVHICGTSYDLAGKVGPSVATVYDFGSRTLQSLCSVQYRLALVEAYESFAWLRTPRFLKKCRGLVSISDYTKTRLARLTGLDSTVIHLWTDENRFRPRSIEASRRTLGLPLDSRILLNVGSGTANKNLRLLNRVVRALPDDYILVKVGFPLPQSTTQVRNKGTVSNDDYPSYFNAADAYIHTSLREGFGIPLIEAMASGTPVVALSSPPTPEVLGEAGRLVGNSASPNEFASAVRAVVESGESRRKLCKLGLDRMKMFDPKVAATLYREMYLNALRS